MKSATFLVWILIGCLFAGCASVDDRSEKYRHLIGKQFTTRYEMKLCKMKRHNYDVVPYTLTANEGDPAAKVLATIPAGTIITVRDAKVSYIGGDWDIIIAEIERPDTLETVVYEDMLGFSSIDPSEFFKRYASLKKRAHPTNRQSQCR
jgi:hypothetical protein